MFINSKEYKIIYSYPMFKIPLGHKLASVLHNLIYLIWVGKMVCGTSIKLDPMYFMSCPV
jgi:hypothetical protein